MQRPIVGTRGPAGRELIFHNQLNYSQRRKQERLER